MFFKTFVPKVNKYSKRVLEKKSKNMYVIYI